MSLKDCEEVVFVFPLLTITPKNISTVTDPLSLLISHALILWVLLSFLSFLFPILLPFFSFLTAYFLNFFLLFNSLSLWFTFSLPLALFLFALTSVELFMPCSSSSVMSVFHSIPIHMMSLKEMEGDRWHKWRGREKQVCLGRSHFPHSTTVNCPWPEESLNTKSDL